MRCGAGVICGLFQPFIFFRGVLCRSRFEVIISN
nr:MAG TPA: hypothetical protein [Caudoviricetes sp.]